MADANNAGDNNPMFEDPLKSSPAPPRQSEQAPAPGPANGGGHDAGVLRSTGPIRHRPLGEENVPRRKKGAESESDWTLENPYAPPLAGGPKSSGSKPIVMGVVAFLVLGSLGGSIGRWFVMDGALHGSSVYWLGSIGYIAGRLPADLLSGTLVGVYASRRWRIIIPLCLESILLAAGCALVCQAVSDRSPWIEATGWLGAIGQQVMTTLISGCVLFAGVCYGARSSAPGPGAV